MDEKGMGARIRALRTARGWSMYQLAKKSGCSPSSVCHYEEGKTMPQIDKAARIAQTLGTTVEALLGLPEYCPSEQIRMLKEDNLRLHKDLIWARSRLQDICNMLRSEIIK